MTLAQSRIEALSLEMRRKEYERVLSASRKIFEMIFTPKGKENIQRVLVSELIDEIMSVDDSKFAAGSAEAVLICACPIDDPDRKRLEDIISAKIHAPAILQVSVDETIIAGIVVKIGALTIDGSLRNKLSKAVAILKESQPE